MVSAIAAAGIAFYAYNASSNEPVSIRTNYYYISGSNVNELKADMRRKGPLGYWAYARWYVRWSADCNVTVSIRYTLPKWPGKDSAPPELRAKWERMITKLREHEEGHGRHGLKAAEEIRATKCRKDPSGIVRKWAAQDGIYDRLTDHGRREGVVLR